MKTSVGFLSKLNWRLMVFHFVASWFFILAFKEFSNLHDLKYKRQLYHLLQINQLFNPKISPLDLARISVDILWKIISGFIGLLIAFMISISISIKYNWLWINSFVVFLISFILNLFKLVVVGEYIKPISILSATIFGQLTIGFYVFNGITLLLIGLLIFFLKQCNRFINSATDRNFRSETE